RFIGKKSGKKSPRVGGKVSDVRIKPFEQQRAQFRAGLASAEAPHFGLFEKVVAGQELIRAFARQDDLEVAVADELGEEKHRDGRGAQQWCFRVPDYLGKITSDVGV